VEGRVNRGVGSKKLRSNGERFTGKSGAGCKNGSSKRSKIGTSLRRLKKTRCEADYEVKDQIKARNGLEIKETAEGSN